MKQLSAPAATAGDRPAGTGKLGLWMTTALVVGNMIGSGVFLLPSALAGLGGISILGWAVTATGALLLALVFSRLGHGHPGSGGPYAYTRLAFGDVLGFQTAWGHWIAIWAGNAAIAVAFVGYLAFFWPALATDRLLAAVVAAAAIWVLTAVNASGVRQGGWVQAITTVLKLVPLVGIALVGLFLVDITHLQPFNASGGSDFGAITSAATLTLWAFIGIESATVPAAEVANPRRTIPRATVIGTLVAATVYILGTVAVLGALPRDQLMTSTAPFADAASAMFGGWAGYVVAAGAVISALGALNGWILLQGQVPLAAARDNLFPRAFARTTRTGVPVFGLVVSSALVTGLMAMNYTSTLVEQFTFVILLATLTTLIPYAYSAAAQLMLLATERERFSGHRFAVDVSVALLAFGYTLWTIVGAGADVVLKGSVLLLVGMPVYVWLVWQARRRPGSATTVTPSPTAIGVTR